MKNHFDKNGNYINVENLSLAEIYHRGYQDGAEDGLQGIRPKGKWIGVVYSYNGFAIGKCNQCGISRDIDKFCSNCGADMRGEDHD